MSDIDFPIKANLHLFILVAMVTEVHGFSSLFPWYHFDVKLLIQKFCRSPDKKFAYIALIFAKILLPQIGT